MNMQKRTAEAVQLSGEAAGLAAARQEAEQRAAKQATAAQSLQEQLEEKERALRAANRQLQEAKASLEDERGAAGPAHLASQRLHQQMQGLQVPLIPAP